MRKRNEAAQRSHSGPESRSRGLSPGRRASGPSVLTLLYFAEESLVGSPPETPGGRAFQRARRQDKGRALGVSGDVESGVLAACEGGLSWKAGHGQDRSRAQAEAFELTA